MIIDTHSHWVPESYAETLRSMAAEFEPARARLFATLMQPNERMGSLTARIAEMDEAGVDTSVLSLPPPGVLVGDRATRVGIARQANDEFLAAAERYPGRFNVLLSLPLPNVDDALAELNRTGPHRWARGVYLLTVSDGWTPDDPSLLPLLHRAAELNLPIFTHPALEPLPAAFGDWLLSASLAPVVSSSLGVARLVLSGRLDDVAGLDVIVPHLGGTLPYLTQRFVDFGNGSAAHDLAWYLRERIYVDTCSFHRPAFDCAVATCGVDRLVMGTDFPIRGPLARAVADIRTALEKPDAQDAVLGGTATRWFGPRP